jgi:gliding motility-associated-like protein
MGYSYSWFPSPSLENSIGIDNKANPIAETYYYASISDGLCIGNTDSVKVSLKPSPISFLSPDSLVVCKDDLASVQASGGTRFNWNIGGTLEAETTDTEKFIKVVSDTYIAVQAIESSCQGNWDTSWIFVDTTFVSANFDVSPLTGNTTFKPTITNTSQGGERYSWDFGNGSVLSVDFTEDNNRSRKYYPVYPFEGDFKISLLATSKNNCKDSSFARVVVGKKFFLHIPSAFSPNGDGINDNFTIIASPGVTFEGSIYNGWGEKIFHSNPLSNSSFWDGTYNNKIVQNGVYVYQITVRELDGTAHYKSGTVQVVR